MSPSVRSRCRRLVLLQFRHNDRAREQEEVCFREAGDLRSAELDARNLCRGESIDWRELSGADAVVIGGAGEYSVTQSVEFYPELFDTVARLVEEDVPVFGSCFGHHILALVTGGQVLTDATREEIGSYEVHLTEEGVKDPLFDELPGSFVAQLGHHDQVECLGPGVIELATSGLCRNQALRVAGKPVYGTQFHPELGVEAMRTRLRMYRDGYSPRHGDFEEFLARLRPSPEASTLFHRFLSICA